MNQYNEMSSIIKKDAGKSNFQTQTQGSSGSSYAKLAKSVALGTIVGVFSSVVLMFVFAFVINAAFGDPDGALNIFTGVAASAGAAAGGFYAARTNGSKGFISGITTGLAISLVILAVMLFGGKSPDSAENSSVTFKLIIIICQIVFACVSGIFAINSRKTARTSRSGRLSGKKK